MAQKKLPWMLFFLFYLSGKGYLSFAQIIKMDTTSHKVYTFDLNQLEWGQDSLTSADTFLQAFHLKHTPLFNEIAWQNQGMWGTPERNLEINSSTAKYFNEGFTSFSHLRKPALHQVQISGKPVSDLHYVQGTPQMIYITARHCQNLGPYASFGIDYRRLKMQNIYFNNLPELDRTRIPNLYNTRVYFRFDHPNSRYLVLLQTISNKITQHETGGLRQENRFDSLATGARLFNQNASLSDGINKFRDLGFHLHQYYILNKKDSVNLSETRLFHHFSIARNFNEFNLTQSDSGYFSHFYSGNITEDRQQFSYINNEAGIGRSDEKWFTKVSLLSQIIGFEGTYGETSSYSNIFIKASARYHQPKHQTGFATEFALTGYNGGDIYLNFHYIRKLSPKQNLKLVLNSMVIEPDFQQQYFYGNHFRWNYHFEKQQSVNAEFSYESLGNHPFQVKLNGGSLKNLIYYRTDGFPAQHAENEIWYKLKVNHSFLFRNWAINNVAAYQQVSTEFLPYPRFLLKSSCFVKGWIFHENMYFESGIDFFYHDAFNAPVYNPATRQFQIQDVKKYGNYPIGDVFLDARIKTVSLMIRWHHANQGIFPESSYILSPGYPILPRSLSFGVRWILMN